ncbi:uncharacterized protein YALI1_D23550g [Yarrowia lipolytica]|uniref:Uncharacterized protein n=1 Tax=Yarrowia lipolytica TaxID=4952 RepID=A0A1D8NF60_YARLL|nr:hypothetical protein YALI1_D23550g [Yarrowia lipolytica]
MTPRSDSSTHQKGLLIRQEEIYINCSYDYARNWPGNRTSHDEVRISSNCSATYLHIFLELPIHHYKKLYGLLMKEHLTLILIREQPVICPCLQHKDTGDAIITSAPTSNMFDIT